MRLHIELADEIVAEIDAATGPRGRTKFVREAITAALEHRHQSTLIRSARGTIASDGHAWDPDPAAWVRDERRADARKVG
jgi:uncharacterized protein YaiI (UPF0178 family)